MNKDMFQNMIDLYNNPLFQKGFSEFFITMQKEGIDAARAFWESTSDKKDFSDDTSVLFEQMISFYSNLGFVPKQKLDEVVQENEKLKKENEFLKKTIQELNLKVFEEGSVKMHDAWKDVVEKQMEINKDMAQNILDLFKKSSGEE